MGAPILKPQSLGLSSAYAEVPGTCASSPARMSSSQVRTWASSMCPSWRRGCRHQGILAGLSSNGCVLSAVPSGAEIKNLGVDGACRWASREPRDQRAVGHQRGTPDPGVRVAAGRAHWECWLSHTIATVCGRGEACLQDAWATVGCPGSPGSSHRGSAMSSYGSHGHPSRSGSAGAPLDAPIVGVFSIRCHLPRSPALSCIVASHGGGGCLRPPADPLGCAEPRTRGL